MASLPRELRKQLENAVKNARRAADAGARNALEGLAVMQGETSRTMSKKERDLRNRLRAHGRQLGDKLDATKGTQAVNRLASEVAYEHWHRMLFARFLAECDLLIEPESGMAASIDEVRELAREQGANWVELASAWAQRMLPQIFRSDDPVLEVSLPPETRQELESILEALPREIFVAEDSLGWVYQFWQAERKDEVNATGDQIGADELPAVTQLFTEDYMVDFLLDNTLGAWHAGKILVAKPTLPEAAQSEDELRNAAALPGCPWKYLRFITGKDGKWTPAAGTFDGWPKTAKELKCLDPCMGSGHFVVAMFARLVALRMAEEMLDETNAIAAVITENLFGLEIDPRCTQIAAFNLGLAAWRRVGHFTPPSMKLACSGLGVNAKEDEWIALAGKNEAARAAMKQLWRLFAQAPLLGSLIDPRRVSGDLFTASFEKVRPLLEAVLAAEERDEAIGELAVTAKGIVGAASILSDSFTLVATNVPYLGRGRQSEDLKEYCGTFHADAKADLATCFADRCLGFCRVAGTATLLTPQNWLFLGTYADFRRRLLTEEELDCVARLGPHAFETITGEVVKVALVTLTRRRAREGHGFFGVNAPERSAAEAKATHLREGELRFVQQARQIKNPDAIITLEALAYENLLGKVASVYVGSQPGQTARVTRLFWEFGKANERTWTFMESSPDGRSPYSGKAEVCLSLPEMEKAAITERVIRGRQAWGRVGVLVAKMSSLPGAIYCGHFYDDNTFAVIPHDARVLPGVWAFVNSGEFATACRKLNQKLNVTASVMEQVPFDVEHWQKVAAAKYPHGLPKPFSSDPTHWLFNGDPKGSDQPLHVAVARLVGYQWPRQTGSSFPDCPGLAPDRLENLANEGGIVCLSATKGEAPAADRLRELLALAWGKDWNTTVLQELLADAGCSGQTLDDWLGNGFFEQHCALFHQTPFLWHLWDGRREGFNAIVNYHKLAGPKGQGRRTLEKLIHTYLGDWIELQRRHRNEGVEGADGRLAAADHLRSELTKIIEGEPPYDLFIRWQPLHEQPIGWEPDINDGVRINSRPFVTARTLGGKSIFRVQPKFKWGKDRGKEPTRPKEDFPWLWGWDETTEDFAGSSIFDGNRWNDLHYSRKRKEEARERATRNAKGSGHVKA